MSGKIKHLAEGCLKDSVVISLSVLKNILLKFPGYFGLFLLSAVFFTSCNAGKNEEEFDPEKNYSGEELSKIYCGGCHLYPEPPLLTAQIWNKKVLPLMGQKLGIIDFDLAMKTGVIPENKVSISDSNWQKIRKFYIENAGSAPEKDENVYPVSSVFKVRVPSSLVVPLTSAMKYNKERKELFLSSNTTLYVLNSNFSVKDSVVFLFPVTDIGFGGQKAEVLGVGYIHPNDRREGKLFETDTETGKYTAILDSLRRPVNFVSVDLNKDGKEEKVVCEFGNTVGELSLFYEEKDGWKKKILSSSPGARKVIANDFDKNGFIDLMVQFGQGDERISIFYNDQMEFEEKVVARFPPVYGLSSFDTLDFNGDGKLDFFAVFGDNSDYSIILKKYHGIRVFVNDGAESFTERHFTSVYGATDAKAADFDLDGDTDFFILSHFADYRNAAQNSLLYLENVQGQLKHKTLESYPKGKWLTLELADFDEDGDKDLVAGSFILGFKSPSPAFIFLENTTR